MELGDHIEQALTKVGITKQRVSKWLGRDCGCAARQEKLNNLSRWAKTAIHEAYESAKQTFDTLVGTEPVNPKAVPVSDEWPEKLDVMYPLGNGSKWNDNELRYSLRSVVENFLPLGKIYIVGVIPAWLDTEQIVHIPAKDTYRNNKDANLIKKVLLACEAGISQKFLRMSDDQLILRPSTEEHFPPIHSGGIGPGGNAWEKRLWNTKRALEKHGLRVLKYDTHSPQIYDRDAFTTIFTKKIRYWKPPGVTINTAYFGVTQPENPVHEAGWHVRRPMQDYTGWAGKARTAGYSDRWLTKEFKLWLEERFPTPTKYELPIWNTSTSRSIERGTWDDIKPFLKEGTRTLEFGSGTSTLLFDQAGCRHTALENNSKYAPDSPSVKICPLAGSWYDWTIPEDVKDDPFEVILLDGPRGSDVRSGFLQVADKLVSPRTTIIVDDTNRRKDSAIAEELIRRFNRRHKRVQGARKEWTIIYREEDNGN